MTQHLFEATLPDGTEVDAMVGYDRPLRGYFGLIERKFPGDEDDEGFIYSQLDSDHPNPKSLDPVVADFANLGITIHPNIIAAVNEDGINDTGNAVTRWDNSTGTVIPPAKRPKP